MVGAHAVAPDWIDEIRRLSVPGHPPETQPAYSSGIDGRGRESTGPHDSLQERILHGRSGPGPTPEGGQAPVDPTSGRWLESKFDSK